MKRAPIVALTSSPANARLYGPLARLLRETDREVRFVGLKPVTTTASLGRRTEQVAKLLSRRVHLLGHGVFGLVAAAVALLRPESLASLVLVDAAAPDERGTRVAADRLAARVAREDGVSADYAVAPITGLDLRPALAEACVPTLVFVCGVPFGDMGAEVFDAMKRAPRQLCVLPRSGHFPWLDARNVFAARVRTFLAENDL
jgi:pimeloyl-ACP methyl ester carboxylesterase